MCVYKLTAVWLLLVATAAAGASTDSNATLIQAAYLYKFCGYIQWPAQSFPEPDSPLVIAVVGNDTMADELHQTVNGRQVNGRLISVRKIDASDKLDGIHILFVGSDNQVDPDKVFDSADSRPILTVTDIDDEAMKGMINFVVIGNRMRFDISQQRAELAGLKLSSQLLSVARHVDVSDRQ